MEGGEFCGDVPHTPFGAFGKEEAIGFFMENLLLMNPFGFGVKQCLWCCTNSSQFFLLTIESLSFVNFFWRRSSLYLPGPYRLFFVSLLFYFILF